MAASLLATVATYVWLIVTPELNTSVERVTEEYARLVASKAPDFDAAREIAERTGIQMRFEGPGGAWTTSEELPAINDLRQHRTDRWLRYAPWRAQYIVPATNGGTFLVSWSRVSRLHAMRQSLLVLLLLMFLVVFLTAHVVLRRVLRPLRTLEDGVTRLSAGELDVVLPAKSADEFGVLTDAFNQMVHRVRDMIRSRDQLLADVSHELRSPVTRLKLALALLPDDDRRARMRANVAEMEAMITELLDLERLRDGRGIAPTRQDVLPIPREIAEAFRDKAPGVRVVSPGEQVVVDIDANRVRTVLRNLLDNAVKYSLPDSRPIEVSAIPDGGMVVITVKDDGPGIPERNIGHVFEPFFRVDRSRSKKTGGYGLGLSICKRIIEAHGGGIAVENNAGRGASFIVTLKRSA